MVGPLTPKPGESAADFKLRIEQAQREKAASRAPTTSPEPAAAPKGTTPAVSVTAPQPAPKATETPIPSAPPAQPPAEPAKPAAEAAPTPPQPRPGDQVEPLEWARKKGLKTPEDIARSLRALETEFHRRNQMPPAPAPSAPAPSPEQPRPSERYIPPAPYQPRPSEGYPPPAPAPRYAPTPAPLSRGEVQWLADTYQIPAEDVERLAPMLMDMVAGAQRRSETRFARLERDNARNSEMFRLMQDPSFQHPEVQFEMHRILEEDPRIFDLEPAPYSVAFNRALVNIARKHVATDKVETPVLEAPPMSSRPPTTLGGEGGSGGGAPKEGALNPEAFNMLPLDKKREVLTSIGARPA